MHQITIYGYCLHHLCIMMTMITVMQRNLQLTAFKLTEDITLHGYWKSKVYGKVILYNYLRLWKSKKCMEK